MNTEHILSELRSQRDRLNQAIAAIEGINSDGAGRSSTRRDSAADVPKRRRRRHMSAAGRKRLSMLLKKRWATGKMKRRARSA